MHRHPFTTSVYPTEAAYGSLKPAPASRLRRASPHLRYSIAFKIHTRSWHNRGIYLTPPAPTYRVRCHGRGLSEDVAGVGTALQHGGSLRRIPRGSALARRMGVSSVRGSRCLVGPAEPLALRPV